MVRIPEELVYGNVPSIDPSRPIVREETSAIAEGAVNLARGVAGLGRGLAQAGALEKKRQNTADLAAAEALYLRKSLEVENGLDNDPDYATHAERATGLLEDVKQEAAALIRDDQMRQAWIGETELKSIRQIDSISDKARVIGHAADVSKFEGSLIESAKLIEDPTVAENVRNRARDDIAGAIIQGMNTGLIRKDQAEMYKQKFLDESEERLSINTARYEIVNGNADAVMRDTGVSASMGGVDVGVAAQSVAGGTFAIPPDVATAVAKNIGDTALPSDPKLQEAYLADPEVNQRYAGEVIDYLTAKYDGDMTAAVIATAPGSSPEIARKWVDSKHDESVLPAGVKSYYREVMNKTSAPAELVHYPIASDVTTRIEDIDIALLDRFEKVQSAFGASILITGGFQNEMSITTKGMKEEEKLRLIKTLSGMGITALAMDEKANTITMGFGEHSWNGDTPAYAKDVIDQHLAGEITELPVGQANVAKRFQSLSFDQRLTLYNEAKQAVDAESVNMRAGIEVAADNAPAAILSTGQYDGYMPSAEDFTRAYGAANGIERYKAFQTQIEVAKDTFSMRTMSYNEIADMLEAKVPRSSGDMAGMEQKRYAALVEAAAATKKAREADPVAYTMDVFPAIKAKWENMGNDPQKFSEALAATALGMDKLGITENALLPKSYADTIVATYNNTELPIDQRVGAVAQAVFATNNDEQRAGILKQLQKAGVPEYLTPAFAAAERGDQNAARYLMRAAVVDAKDIPTPKIATDTEIKEAITSVFDRNQIGDIVYGLTGGKPDNAFRVAQDVALFDRAVRLRLADGSASSLDDAVAKTTQDFFGNVVPLAFAGSSTAAGMKVTVPAGENVGDFRTGFTALLPEVAEALYADTANTLSGLPTADGSLQLGVATRENGIKMTLREGHFANFGDGQYVFLDMQGTAINGPDGQPLVWTAEDVKAAAAGADPGQKQLNNYRSITGGSNMNAQDWYDTIGGQRPLTRDPFK